MAMNIQSVIIINIINFGWAVGDVLSVAVPLQYDLQFYVESLFSSYHEVHSFQMGVYAGALVLVLTARRYTRAATALTVAMFAFALGFPPASYLCDPAAAVCGGVDVQGKPWYFATGLLVVGVLGPWLLKLSAVAATRLTSPLPVETVEDDPPTALSAQPGPYAHVRAALYRIAGLLGRAVPGAWKSSSGPRRTDGGREPSGPGDGIGERRDPLPEFEPPAEAND